MILKWMQDDRRAPFETSKRFRNKLSNKNEGKMIRDISPWRE
jgi:hypothetical protein